MYACMYVCIYACMYVYMHECMYVCMYACMYVCIYVCMHVSNRNVSQDVERLVLHVLCMGDMLVHFGVISSACAVYGRHARTLLCD